MLAERIHRALPATRHKDFRALWGGTACSSIALWTLLLGNAWIVFKLSDSSFWVAVSTFASMSPFLLSPFGGIIADRFERAYLVRVTRVGGFVITATLAILAVTGVLSVGLVVGMALLQGIVRAVELPSDQAMLANVVPQEDLANAVSLSTMTQQGSRAAGPLLSGPLIAWVGVEGAYGMAALFTLLSFTSMWRITTRSRGGVSNLKAVTANLGNGLRYIGSHRPVFALFALVVAHCALTMSFDAMLPTFASDHVQGHAHEAHSGPGNAFVLMSFGVGMGSLISTLWLALFPGGHRGRLLFITAIASGIAPMLMSVSLSVPSAVASAVFMGASQALFMALSAVLLQEVVPDAVRGRVMSFYSMSAGGVMAFANLGFGSLADVWNAPALFLYPGTVFTVAVIATAFSGNHLRQLYRVGRVPAESPATA